MSEAAQESASPASAWGTSASASGVTESNQNRHKITESRHTMGVIKACGRGQCKGCGQRVRDVSMWGVVMSKGVWSAKVDVAK